MYPLDMHLDKRVRVGRIASGLIHFSLIVKTLESVCVHNEPSN